MLICSQLSIDMDRQERVICLVWNFDERFAILFYFDRPSLTSVA